MKSKIIIPLALTACAALAAGILFSVLWIPTPTPRGLEQSSSPAVVKASKQVFADPHTVESTFTLQPQEALTARASGTVTETLCKPGAAVESGSRIMNVDGVPIVALHTETPLYRELHQGDQGADVLSLQRELSRLGYAAEGNGKYGAATARGVNSLMRKVGRSDAEGTIKPSDVVWMPATSVVAAECAAKLNTTVSEGVEVMKAGGGLASVSYVVPEGMRDGKRMFALYGQTIPLDTSDGTITDRTFLDALEKTDEFRGWKDDGGGKRPKAILSLATPFEVTKVPPSAVFGMSGKRACVSLDGKEAMPVTVLGSALGATLIEAQSGKQKISEVHVGDDVRNIACPAADGGK